MVGGAAKLRIGIFLALLALPLVHQRLPLLPSLPLAGTEEPAKLSPPRPRAFWSGEFQSSFDPWLSRRLRLREWLVRIDNQVGITVFGEPPRGGTPMVIGREGTLIEKVYVDEYNRPRRLSPRGVAKIVEELQRLDGLLAARGVRFIVAIAPSKPEIYPELLPPRHVLPGREQRKSLYQQIAPALERSGVTVIDGHRILLDERRRSDIPLFARGGTHWNHYANALVAARLLEELERGAPGRFVQLEVTGARTDRTVWVTDDDLGALLNVFWPRPWPGPQTHPVFERRAEGRVPARLRFTGDSFTLQFLEFMTAEGLMEPGESLFYFNRRVRYPGGAIEPLDRERFDPARELAGLDALVFVASEYYLGDQGFGFVAAAIRGLEAAAPSFQHPASAPGGREAPGPGRGSRRRSASRG